MNREHVQLWIDALRSGKYKKLRNALHRDDRFCALGVACEVYREQTGRGEWAPADMHALRLFIDGETGTRSFCAPPAAVSRWYGLNTEWNEKVRAIIILNDSKRARFATIAKYLEKALNDESSTTDTRG